jgi:GAF domain-containing protein
MSVAEDQLREALRVVRQFVAGYEPLEETLDRVTRLGTAALGADLAGLTLAGDDGRPGTVACTGREALEIDESQYRCDRGPCLDAYRSMEVVRVEDAAGDPRWPEFTAAARAHGIRASLSLPLVAERKGLGALNLYARERGPFTDDEVEAGLLYATQAAVALANARAWAERDQAAQGLARAMESRATIEQAKGVVMATTGCTPDEAFEVLRVQSQAENRKLRDIAAELVERQRSRRDPAAG